MTQKQRSEGSGDCQPKCIQLEYVNYRYSIATGHVLFLELGIHILWT